jgi:Protein of unknown function (DUF3485)
MTRIAPFVVGLGILMASELLHGHWTDRWRFSGEAEAACTRLPRSDEPMTVGDWKGHPAGALQHEDIVIGEIAGYFNQTFVHPNGSMVQVLVLCGRPGPIAVHSPEVCLGGEGCVQDGKKERCGVDLPSGDGRAEFWVGQFFWFDGGLRKDRRQFWTYSADGTWKADDNPRLHFARFPFLYKIYIVRQMPRRDEKLEEDPTLDFIKVFMPEIQKRLFGPGAKS